MISVPQYSHNPLIRAWRWITFYISQRSNHDYQYADKTQVDTWTLKRSDGTTITKDRVHYLYQCSYCGNYVWFSEKWDSYVLAYFNKCKRGHCTTKQ